MADQLDFESRLDARLRARASLADRPFDAVSIAQTAIPAREAGPSRWRARRAAWLVAAAALVLAGSVGLALVAGSRQPVVDQLTSSPGNGWIAYSTKAHTATFGVVGQIFVTREGVEPRLVAGDGQVEALCPAFSPDGGQLAYVDGDDVVVLAGDPAQPMQERLRFPIGPARTGCAVWSPSGDLLAIIDAGRIALLPLDGSALRVVGPKAKPTDFARVSLAWAPDAATIAFGTEDGIWLVPVDGSASRLLASFRPLTLSWSPDGTRLAAAGLDGPGETQRLQDALSVFAIAGDAPVLMRDGSSPQWSPAGEWLAYDTPEDGLLIEDGAGQVRLVSIRNGYGFGGWSPDGRYLFSMRDVSGSSWDLVAHSAFGGPFFVIATSIQTGSSRNFPDVGDVSWQPVLR